MLWPDTQAICHVQQNKIYGKMEAESDEVWSSSSNHVNIDNSTSGRKSNIHLE